MWEWEQGHLLTASTPEVSMEVTGPCSQPLYEHSPRPLGRALRIPGQVPALAQSGRGCQADRKAVLTGVVPLQEVWAWGLQDAYTARGTGQW